jgi:hypothetical protein
MIAFPGLVSLVMPGLDPGIHQNQKSGFFDQRWIAGSSISRRASRFCPAMTADGQAK